MSENNSKIANKVEPITEATAIDNIITWSLNRCAWQRDALRRIFESDNLTQEDFKELVKIAKKELMGSPILHTHVKDPKSADKKVELRAVFNVSNVNALAVNQRLQFSPTGLTAIYGDNGAGKSGYIRILKQVCRARDPKKTDILANINNSETALMQAEIAYISNSQNHTINWSKGQILSSTLSSISIFDSNTASIHVDSTNDVAYVPFPLELLKNLADACKSVKEILQNELSDLKSRTPSAIKNPQCAVSTSVGQLIAKLNARTDPSTVEALALLTEEEETRYGHLCSDLAHDPTIISKDLNAKLARLNKFITKAQQLLESISQEKYFIFKQLVDDYNCSKAAANLAASNLFKNDPLPNIGSDTWKMLWESARNYSEKVAYRNKNFPVTEEGAYCLLCQQTLLPEAQERLNRFELFVTDDTKQKEQIALRKLDQFKNSLLQVSPSMGEIKEVFLLCKEELNDELLANSLKAFFVQAKWRIRCFLKLGDVVPPIPEIPKESIDSQILRLEKRIADLTAADIIESRKKLLEEKKELEDRKWLKTIKEDLKAEIDRKIQIEVLDKLIREETNSSVITSKSTEISESLITNALRAQFAKEVDKMKLSGLALELIQERSAYAVPQFRVSLTINPKAKVGQILSEGEFRCIALAAFLAELVTTHNKAAIVFDDPVSSLDHLHRETVADRLATESLNRQVVVFTHDIHFLFLLDKYCKERASEIHYRHLTKRPDGATGLCHNDAPPKAQNVEKRVQSIQNRLNNEKIHYEQGNETKWHQTVLALQQDLRTTWERAVEDVISPVLSRFSNEVKTPGLLSLTILTEEDCYEMRKAFGRCSNWMHSSGIGLNPQIPTPDEVDAEIKCLSTWYDDIMNRQKKIKS